METCYTLFVKCNVVFFAVNAEFAVFYAVCILTYNNALIIRTVNMTVKVLVTNENINKISVGVFYNDFIKCGAFFKKLNFSAFGK